MPISIFDAVNDPVSRSAILRSQLLGKDFLDRELVSRGVSKEDGRALESEISVSVEGIVDSLEQSDIAVLADLLNQAALSLAASAVGDWRALIANAEALAQSPRLLAADQTKRGIARALAFSMITLIASAHVSGKYDLRTGDGEIEFSIGLSPSLQGALDEVRDLLKIGHGAPPVRSNRKPDEKSPHHASPTRRLSSDAGSIEPGKPAAFADGREFDAASLVSTSSDSPPALVRASPHGSLDHCREAVERIEAAFRSGRLLDELGGAVKARSLFQRLRVAGYPPAIEDYFRDMPFTLGYAIVSQRPAVGTRALVEERRYRAAVRIQSPWRPLVHAMPILASLMDRIGAGNPQTRWTSPVLRAASNPTGLLKKWAKQHRSPPEIGCCIGPPGGAAGSLGLFLRGETDDYYALTAGHVAWDDGLSPGDDTDKFPLGREFHHPAQPLSPPAGATPIGSVRFCRTFPAGSLAEGISGAAESFDYCLIKLDAGFVPQPQARRTMGHRQFAREAWNDDAFEGMRVVKSVARSGEAICVVTSERARLQLINYSLGQIQDIGPVIEAAVDNESPIKTIDFGDSGSLACAEIEGVLRPLGIVVGYAVDSQLGGSGARRQSVIYIQALAQILGSDERLANLRIA